MSMLFVLTPLSLLCWIEQSVSKTIVLCPPQLQGAYGLKAYNTAGVERADSGN
jgi:hypothetical protein